METLAIKGIVLAALFILTFGAGLIPMKIISVARKRSTSDTSAINRIKYKRGISFLNCFAAGVFLGTCLMDLLPDVREDLSNAIPQTDTFSKFPVAEFVMIFGLFMILIVEQIVLSVKEKSSQPNEKTPLMTREASIRNRNVSLSSDHSIEGIRDEPIPIKSGSFSCSNKSYTESHKSSHEINFSHGHSHSHGLEHNHSTLRSVLLLCAISLHSIFEGLAVGLQKDSEGVLGLFAALVLHKGIISFSIGLSLVQSKLSRKTTFLSILFFSMTSSIGIGIGMAVTDLGDSSTSSLVQGILSGIACGTFLYVTFFEIMPHEFNSKDQRMLKLVFLLLGFAIFTGVLFWHVSTEKPE